MTTSGMAICPRRSDGSDVGYVELNGTLLGGTLMVKNEEEWDILRTQPEKLTFILNAIGLPKSLQNIDSLRL
jgi:sulfate adenylyltransferase (ADP) / ATP adenylyltransferase